MYCFRPHLQYLSFGVVLGWCRIIGEGLDWIESPDRKLLGLVVFFLDWIRLPSLFFALRYRVYRVVVGQSHVGSGKLAFYQPSVLRHTFGPGCRNLGILKNNDWVFEWPVTTNEIRPFGQGSTVS